MISNMKTWLKGGIVASVILILQVIISFIGAAIMAPKCGECSIVFMLVLYPKMYFFSWVPAGIIFILVQILVYFSIGAIIGFIIGKIKSRA
jgi:hypothetical protein